MRGIGWCIGLATLLGACGCADNRPAYAEPVAGAVEPATLKGFMGTYVEGVDGSRVQSAQIQMYNFGANTVHVSAGKHSVIVVQNISSGRHMTRVINKFTMQFDAGHTYDVGPSSFWQPAILKITDKKTGRSWTVDPEEDDSDNTPGFLYDLMGA
jgi:hypothetical protein